MFHKTKFKNATKRNSDELNESKNVKWRGKKEIKKINIELEAQRTENVKLDIGWLVSMVVCVLRRKGIFFFFAFLFHQRFFLFCSFFINIQKMKIPMKPNSA